MKKYSVILPAYKELENLKILIPNLLQMFRKIKRESEIIVVDDNSNDGTREFLEGLRKKSKPVRLIERRNERGISSAMLRGTDEASYENIVHMDSDLAHDVKDLEHLLKEYEKKDDKYVVIGSRYAKGSTFQGKPLLNILASKVGRLVIRYFFGLPIHDASNNFRIFSKKVWQQIRTQLTLEGNVMLVQELILMKKAGCQFTEMSTSYIERRLGESKLSVAKETKNFFKALPALWRDVAS